MDKISADEATRREIEAFKVNGTLFPERQQAETAAVEVDEANIAAGGIAAATEVAT